VTKPSGKFLSADFKLVRQINRAAVLKIICERASISRTGISRLTGLNKSTISGIVKELIEEDLVVEESLGESAIGRKPVILKLNKRSRIIGVIEITTHITTLAVCDLEGTLLEKKNVATPSGDADAFFRGCGRTLVETAGSLSGRLAGVGISLPGLVDSVRGFLYTNDTLGWCDVDVRGIIEKQMGCKVFVENDAKAGALAELWFAEETRDLENFVFIWVCDGIGVGIVMNNSLYHGYSSLDGQFGHQLIKIDGRWEDVSGENTWEDNASEIGVLKRYSEHSGSQAGPDTEKETQLVIDLARSGDHSACRALKETARYLGVGIANINNGLGPQRIIVGGRLVQAWDLIFPEMLRQVERQTIYQMVPVRELIIPGSLSTAPFDGARAMVLRDLFGGYNLH